MTVIHRKERFDGMFNWLSTGGWASQADSRLILDESKSKDGDAKGV